ncbi:MAG: hypothetical protein LH617_15105 [Ramlibacter sp.]|nr:hypothetical protein [Ramlibacter sp.]
MHAVFSPGELALPRARRESGFPHSVRHALRWGAIVALGLAAAALLSYGISVFETSVATQLTAGNLQHGFSLAERADAPDPFLQQKWDAKLEELPTQF